MKIYSSNNLVANFGVDPVKVRNLVRNDPVALRKWSQVRDDLVSDHTVVLRTDQQLNSGAYDAAVLETLRCWKSSLGKKATFEALDVAFRKHSLVQLADTLEREKDTLYETTLPAESDDKLSYINILPNLPAKMEGRAAEATRLHEIVTSCIGSGESIVSKISVLTGVRGVGKTTLALTYAKGRAREEAFPHGVVWIDMEDEVIQLDSFNFIAKKLKARNNQKQNLQKQEALRLAESARNVLQALRNKDCLVVFENVRELSDIVSLLREVQLSDGIAFLVITFTQCRAPQHPQLILDSMDAQEAKEWVERSLGRNNVDRTEDDIESLVEKLGCFPLALRQALSYIDARFGNPTERSSPIQEYLYQFETNSQKILNLKNSYDPEEVTVLAAWSTTFEEILNGGAAEENNNNYYRNLAISVLELIYYLEETDFSSYFLSKLPTWFGGSIWRWCRFVNSEVVLDTNELHSAMDLLYTYSVINRKPGHKREGQFYVHQLVKEVVAVLIVPHPNHLYLTEKVYEMIKGEEKLRAKKRKFYRQLIYNLVLNVLEAAKDNVKKFVGDNFLRAKSTAQHLCGFPELVKSSPGMVIKLYKELLCRHYVSEVIEVLKTCIPQYDKIFPPDNEEMKEVKIEMKYEFIDLCMKQGDIFQAWKYVLELLDHALIATGGSIIFAEWVLEICDKLGEGGHVLQQLQILEHSFMLVSQKFGPRLTKPNTVVHLGYRLFTLMNPLRESDAFGIMEYLASREDLVRYNIYLKYVIAMCATCRNNGRHGQALSMLLVVIPTWAQTYGRFATSTMELKYYLLDILLDSGCNREALQYWHECADEVKSPNWPGQRNSAGNHLWAEHSRIRQIRMELFAFLIDSIYTSTTMTISSFDPSLEFRWNPFFHDIINCTELCNSVWGIALLLDQWEALLARKHRVFARKIVKAVKSILREHSGLGRGLLTPAGRRLIASESTWNLVVKLINRFAQQPRLNAN